MATTAVDRFRLKVTCRATTTKLPAFGGTIECRQSPFTHLNDFDFVCLQDAFLNGSKDQFYLYIASNYSQTCTVAHCNLNRICTHKYVITMTGIVVHCLRFFAQLAVHCHSLGESSHRPFHCPYMVALYFRTTCHSDIYFANASN